MKDLAVFSVGHDRSRWLAARASATARNVANADTPGYQAQDVAPFATALKSAAADLMRTQSNHFAASPTGARAHDLIPRPTEATKHSGNTVSLEMEMAALGETRSQQSLVSGILGAFHRMLLSSTKG